MAAFELSPNTKSGGRVHILGAKNDLDLACLSLSILSVTGVLIESWLWAVRDLSRRLAGNAPGHQQQTIMPFNQPITQSPHRRRRHWGWRATFEATSPMLQGQLPRGPQQLTSWQGSWPCSMQKCPLAPQPTTRFLGFVVNTLAQAFRVPEDKITAFATRVDGLGQQREVTGREVTHYTKPTHTLALTSPPGVTGSPIARKQSLGVYCTVQLAGTSQQSAGHFNS